MTERHRNSREEWVCHWFKRRRKKAGNEIEKGDMVKPK